MWNVAEDHKRKRKAIVACKAILRFWSQEFALQAAKWKVCEKALPPAAYLQCSTPNNPPSKVRANEEWAKPVITLREGKVWELWWEQVVPALGISPNGWAGWGLIPSTALLAAEGPCQSSPYQLLNLSFCWAQAVALPAAGCFMKQNAHPRPSWVNSGEIPLRLQGLVRSAEENQDSSSVFSFFIITTRHYRGASVLLQPMLEVGM